MGRKRKYEGIFVDGKLNRYLFKVVKIPKYP